MADPLRKTLDELALPAEAGQDRDYLVSVLRRLGYSEAEIEAQLGPDPRTRVVEVEYEPGEFEVEAAQSVAAGEALQEPVPAAADVTQELPPETPIEEPAEAAPPEQAASAWQGPVSEEEEKEAELLRFNPPAPVTPAEPEPQVEFEVVQQQQDLLEFVPDNQPESQEPFAYEVDYRLYARDVKLPTGRTQRIYFFSRTEPKQGVASPLPPGYEVLENPKTGLPYLARIDPRRPRARPKRRRVEASGAFQYGPYALYARSTDDGAGGRHTEYMFSQEPLEGAEPAPFPEGYELHIHDTGLPYLVNAESRRNRRVRVRIVRGRTREEAEESLRGEGRSVLGAVPIQLDAESPPEGMAGESGSEEQPLGAGAAGTGRTAASARDEEHGMVGGTA